MTRFLPHRRGEVNVSWITQKKMHTQILLKERDSKKCLQFLYLHVYYLSCFLFPPHQQNRRLKSGTYEHEEKDLK